MTWILLACAAPALAQDALPTSPPQPEPPPQVSPTPPDVQTLEEVRALPPEEEALDLYRFKNPVKVETGGPIGGRFSEPPSPKEISEGGGYVMYGINKAIGAAAKGLQNIPGVRDQVQSAVARPPPELTEEQRQRLLRACGADSACEAPPLP
ncbi:MAG: hypothetical protein ABW178_02060 [Pseudoxanthomonas sp.]